MNLPLGTHIRMEMNVGQVLQLMALLCGIALFLFNAGGENAATKARMDQMDVFIKATNDKLDGYMNSSNASRQIYLPKVEESARKNDLQDEQIQMLSDAVKDIRSSAAETAKVLNIMSQDIAVIKANTKTGPTH